MDVMHAAHSLMGDLLRPIHAGDQKLTTQQSADLPAQQVAVRSSAFADNEFIPKRYSQDGENISPAISWSNVPGDARELVLICEDPDAPMAEPFIHWVVFGLSPSASGLPENVPTTPGITAGGFAAKQGVNSAGKIGYVGPKPPAGHGVYHYHFQLFALNAPSLLSGDPDRDALSKSLQGRVIAKGDLVGLYERT